MRSLPMHHHITTSFKSYALWLFLGWNDIVLRYKRTVIGPFWMVLSTGLNIAALGIVFASIFKQDIKAVFPYIATGIITWTYISTLIIEGSAAFTTQAHIIQNIPTPLFSFCLRIFVRNTIIFLHNLLVLFFILCFTIGFHWVNFLIFPVLLIFFINSAALSTILGTICARFNDVSQMITTLLSVLIFVTPILWKPDMLGTRRIIADINPFTHYIELIRAPLLGDFPSLFSIQIVLALTLLNIIIAYCFMKKYYHRIVFWI